MVNPVAGYEALVNMYTGTPTSLTDEAMSVVDESSQGYAAYTVYQITDPLKRGLVPTGTFVWYVNGAPASPAPAQIQPLGARIIFAAALLNTDVVTCHSGTYYPTITPFVGCNLAKVNSSLVMVPNTKHQDDTEHNFPDHHKWSVEVDEFIEATCASGDTNINGSNNDLTFWHLGGLAGNGITVTGTDPGTPSQGLAISVSGTDVTVSLKTNSSSVIVSTSGQVADAINQNQQCIALKLKAKNKSGNDGSGTMATWSAVTLSGGADVPNRDALLATLLGISVVDRKFSNHTSRREGYCYLSDYPSDLSPGKLITRKLTFVSAGDLWRRTV
jgi:hypothetical protein